MRCSICKTEIKYELHIKDLFIFDFICCNCKKVIKEKKIIIPIDDGYIIEYIYFLDEKEYDDNICYKIYPKILEILKRYKNKIILFLDDDALSMIPYLRFRQNIVLISIKYIDISYYYE